jgi:hypothetical protein
MAMFVDGEERITGKLRAARTNKTLSTANETPVIAIRLKSSYKNRLARGQLQLNFVAASIEHTKPVELLAYVNPTLTDASFVDIDTLNSAVEKDISASAFSGGRFLFSLPLGKTSDKVLDLSNNRLAQRFNPGDIILFTADPSSGTNAEVTVSVNFTELL